MALVVEDGTGKADADSYISVTDATAYHAERGNTAWAALANDTIREQLLRKATDYMMAAYRDRWAGYRVSTTQALDWPRYDVPMKDGPGRYGYGGESYYPSNSVPTAVARACAELALKATDGDLVSDGSQATKREKVGPLEIEYQDYTTSSVSYRAVDGMLTAYFIGNSGQIRLARG